MLGYTEGSVPQAARSGFLNAAIPAIFGTLIWRWSGRSPWPAEPGLSFFALHLAIAIGYSVTWAFTSLLIGMLISGESLSGVMNMTGVSWRLLLGIWVYGCTVGVCYAIRNAQERQRLVTERLEAESLASESTLATLRAQLNPHFLFNALHSIGALVHEDPKAASKSLSDVGEMLRYVLRDDTEPFVTLAQEIEFVANFTRVMNRRLEVPLDLELNIGDQAGDASIPRLSIQPLVENVFRHAGSGQVHAGRIVIQADVDDGFCRIRVSDDGCGTDLPQTALFGRGLGLDNLRQRMMLLYDREASLSVETRAGHGFAVTMTMPFRSSNNGTGIL